MQYLLHYGIWSPGAGEARPLHEHAQVHGIGEGAAG